MLDATGIGETREIPAITWNTLVGLQELGAIARPH
jgi:hypothetical protein